MSAFLNLKLSRKRFQKNFYNYIYSSEIERLTLILFILLIIGLISHAFAKLSLISFRGINCFSEIRFAWIEVGHHMQTTIMRITSIIGNLFTSLVYPILFILTIMILMKKKYGREHYLYLGIFILSLFIGFIAAYLIGSRNTMLSYLILVFSSIVLCFYLKDSIDHTFIIKSLILFLMPLVLLVTATAFIFNDRMFCAHNSKNLDYSSIEKAYIQSYEDEIPIKILESNSSLCVYCEPVIIYLNHGIYNYAYIAHTQRRGDLITISIAKSYLRKIGFNIDVSDTKRVHGSGGIGLIGTVYHDYGYSGIILASIMFGGLTYFTLRNLHNNYYISLNLICFIMIIYTIGMSLMFFPVGLHPFNLKLIGMIVGLQLIPKLKRVFLKLRNNRLGINHDVDNCNR